MFEDVGEVWKKRKKYNSKMFLSGVSTFREIEELESNAFREGALEQKHKELIALGISISHACYGWIEYHVSSAADLGASQKEILEATAVAVAMGGGLAQWPARYVFKVLEELKHSGEGEAVDSKTWPGTPWVFSPGPTWFLTDNMISLVKGLQLIAPV